MMATQNDLWGGPYPLAVDSVAPTVVKVWFSTTTKQLLVWNYAVPSWVPVASTAIVGGNSPPSPAPLGTLWLDAQPKLWVHVDDWKELTQPVSGGPTAPDGAKFTAATSKPSNPAAGDLWFEPKAQNLSVWNGTNKWVKIGQRVQRNVRFGSYPVPTWNAGGNRSQAVLAGGFMYMSGIRGIDPATQQQVPGPGPGNTPGTIAPNLAPNGNARIIQIYTNIKNILEAEGLSLYDVFGLFTSLTSAAYIGPTATLQALPQFWGNGPYPCRTHEVWLQMSGSDTERENPIVGWPARGDIVEVQVMVWAGNAGKRNPAAIGKAADVRAIPSVSVQTFD
jgi:enamine deaminase RidA (YjgF/YER057c/UK114 family)